MHLFVPITLFSTLAAAADPLGSSSNPLLFTAVALGPSGTSLNAAPISANGLSFWIGKPTLTAGDGGDPLSAINSENTKNKNTTIFKYINGEGKFHLAANVHGGQAVYVDGETGALKFTKGNGFSKIPAGGVDVGFQHARGDEIQFERDGWVACPEKGSKDVWRVFAESRNKGKGVGCQGIKFQVTEVKAEIDGGPATAWMYV